MPLQYIRRYISYVKRRKRFLEALDASADIVSLSFPDRVYVVNELIDSLSDLKLESALEQDGIQIELYYPSLLDLNSVMIGESGNQLASDEPQWYSVNKWLYMDRDGVKKTIRVDELLRVIKTFRMNEEEDFAYYGRTRFRALVDVIALASYLWRYYVFK